MTLNHGRCDGFSQHRLLPTARSTGPLHIPAPGSEPAPVPVSRAAGARRRCAGRKTECHYVEHMQPKVMRQKLDDAENELRSHHELFRLIQSRSEEESVEIVRRMRFGQGVQSLLRLPESRRPTASPSKAGRGDWQTTAALRRTNILPPSLWRFSPSATAEMRKYIQQEILLGDPLALIASSLLDKSEQIMPACDWRPRPHERVLRERLLSPNSTSSVKFTTTTPGKAPTTRTVENVKTNREQHRDMHHPGGLN
ncbi:uncharacterized protein B0I36DRAFT_347864 [Microdochium trichocladiopsis]|uniref:Uncharacterized protein n=1 Tax=Microdochium trichocladiopsis TaxID=1682393 RepID=A0A9P9BRF9_9PEZI|nr:uncharacterized protein B0I36DRAFT_347864 [Microdochium trichocladiopsis]KAH7032683.1 hypothetical protein B0I36DRAFT_347864 [Microdochium trichocladiopsis]